MKKVEILFPKNKITFIIILLGIVCNAQKDLLFYKQLDSLFNLEKYQELLLSSKGNKTLEEFIERADELEKNYMDQ